MYLVGTRGGQGLEGEPCTWDLWVRGWPLQSEWHRRAQRLRLRPPTPTPQGTGGPAAPLSARHSVLANVSSWLMRGAKKFHLAVVLFCISLIASQVIVFSYVCFPLQFLFWEMSGKNEPIARFSIGFVFFLNCINASFKELGSFSVTSSVGDISQLITCFLTSAVRSCVCCAEIPNFSVVKFISLFMTLRKAHPEIILFNSTMLFPPLFLFLVCFLIILRPLIHLELILL